MPSEKSSIVSFQPSRGCICSHISRVSFRTMKSWVAAHSQDERRPIRLQGCRPSLIDKLADTYYISRLSWGGGLCSAPSGFRVLCFDNFLFCLREREEPLLRNMHYVTCR